VKKFFLLLSFIILNSLFLILASPVSAQNTFKFVAWGDTKSDTNVLKSLSSQIKTLNPKFTIFAGDLESSGFTQGGMDAWKNAINAGVNNGLLNITFPVRGNHDNQATGSPTGWQAYFNLSAAVQGIGAANYSFLDDDLTYSFDYGNSRIIGIDVLGNVTQMTPAQITWLDQRLADAESKSLQHAFLFWHGPFYSQANHCCPVPSQSLISVINKHSIVSAGFYGHEHTLTYTHIDSSRVPGITRGFEQIVSGDAGAGPTTPTSGRYDYLLNLGGGNSGGFAVVDVSGSSFTLSMYKGGSTTAQYSKTFSKSGVNPPPVTITVTPPGTSPGSKPGDANGDNLVDGQDYVIWLQNYNTQASGAAKGNFDGNGVVDGQDYVIWLNNYNK